VTIPNVMLIPFLAVFPLLLTLGATHTSLAGESHVTKCDVFRHQGKDWYRIPSLVVGKEGAVLAFASRRKGGLGDFGHDTDVVLRRSLDGGKTWQPMQTVVSRAGTDVHHGPAIVLRETGAVLKFCRYWPVEAEGGPHKFVSSTPYAKMKELGWCDHVVRSLDDGRTWSDPQPMHLPFPPGATSAATGNGNHGIQLADGRLLIQGGYVLDGTRHSCIFLSDDGGKTWSLGAAGAIGGTLREFGMAELADGSVYVNLRSHQKGYRAVTRSRDSGASFGPVAFDTALPAPRCHAGVVRYPTDDSTQSWLVFVNPANKYGGGGLGSTRHSLTLRLSRDGGATWPVARLLHAGPAAYADLAVLPDGTIGCLYEGGDKGAYDALLFARVSLAWLAEGKGGE